jgi:hypothetical protein
MGAPPLIALIPNDWVELERILNHLYQILDKDTNLTSIVTDIEALQDALALLDDVSGAEGDVQYNKSSGHGAEAALNYNESTNLLNLQGTARVTRLLAGGVQS